MILLIHSITSQLLLRRPDIDVQLRDNEGLTPFDLYNLTVEGTWPLKRTADSYELLNDEDTIGDIFTWGGNRCVCSNFVVHIH